MTQPRAFDYVVAYGYSQQFKLTKEQAQHLIRATEQGAKVVKFDNLVLSTNFSWIAPVELVDKKELDSKELALCEGIAEWLSRDANELSWSFEGALDYSKKLMKRVGYGEVRELWDIYANGAYPSVKRFLMEAKQVSDLEEPVNADHLLE